MVDGNAGAEVALLAFPGSLAVGLRGSRAGQPAICQPKRMERIAATAGPPDPVALCTGRQAEPALGDRLAIDDFCFLEVDERELMRVVTGRGGECVAIVSERDDVERKVGQGNRPAGRLQRPAVRQEKALFGRACVARRFLGQKSADCDRTPSQESRRRDGEKRRSPGHGMSLPLNEVALDEPIRCPPC